MRKYRIKHIRSYVEPLAEAAGKGKRWDVRIIRSGRSENGRDYAPAALREAVPLFEAVPVFAVSDNEHVAGISRDVRRMVGRITSPRYVGDAERGAVHSTLEIIHPDGELGQWLVAAHRDGLGDMYGLSIQAHGRVSGGRVTRISKVNSVDLVVSPAAGGRFLRLIEATIMKPNKKGKGKGKGRKVQLAEARERLAGSSLPKPARKRLRSRLETVTDLSEAAVDRMIADERQYLAAVAPGGQVTGLGGGDIRITEGRETKIPEMLDAFWDPQNRDVVSLRETYIQLTGDKRVTGEARHCDRTALREAITIGTGNGAGVFAQVFGDSLTRRVQRMYRETGIWDWYKKVCTEVPAMDFRSQKRPLWGGYGDLPDVAQSAPYTDLASPTDVEESYTVVKRGGVEKITLEAIKNDDVSVVMRLPMRLAMAAKRTLSGHVAAIFTMGSGAGPTMEADALTLFHASHGNRGTSALSAAAVAAGRLAMVKQVELSSNKQIGIPPKTLLVPWEMQETGYNIFRMGERNDQDFVQSLMYDVCPVPDWTDTSDWVLVADPMMMETIEIGYLDGMMEPEIFVQQDEHYGSMFANDEWSFKIRHIYGMTAMDWRGFYKSLVP